MTAVAPLARRLAVSVVTGLVAGLLLAAGLIRLLENRFIYFPPRYPEGFESPGRSGLGIEDVWLNTEDRVRINAWFMPDPSSAKVLLWFHGNAANIGYGLEQLETFARLGVNVMALDYRGYGKSEGTPDEAGIYRDADATYRDLVETRRFQPQNIFIYGHSLGGAVAIDLASRRECGGLIVESSFTRGTEMARRMLLIPLLEYIPKSRFDSLAKITRVGAPILVMHGTRDSVVPFSMGERLYEAAREPKSFFPVEGAGHDDVFLVGGERYLERLRRFVNGRVTDARGKG